MGCWAMERSATLTPETLRRLRQQFSPAKATEGKIYPLTGPESLAMTEVATRLSTALGKEVEYVNVAPDQIKAVIIGMGAPEFMADGLVELYMMISEGMADMVVGTFKEITGHDRRDFGQFAQDFASAFDGTSS